MSIEAPVSMIILMSTLLIFTTTVGILDLLVPVEYKYSSSLLESLSSSSTIWILSCQAISLAWVWLPCLHMLGEVIWFSTFPTCASLCWARALFVWPFIPAFLTRVGRWPHFGKQGNGSTSTDSKSLMRKRVVTQAAMIEYHLYSTGTNKSKASLWQWLWKSEQCRHQNDHWHRCLYRHSSTRLLSVLHINVRFFITLQPSSKLVYLLVWLQNPANVLRGQLPRYHLFPESAMCPCYMYWKEVTDHSLVTKRSYYSWNSSPTRESHLAEPRV